MTTEGKGLEKIVVCKAADDVLFHLIVRKPSEQ